MENSIRKKERKLKTELLYDPAIPFLSIYLKENTVWKDAYTPVFTAALFTIARQVLRYTKSLQWCQTLCDAMDGSLLGSSVHVILQARILEWVAIVYSRGSSQARDQTNITDVPCICRWVPPGNPDMEAT